MWDSRCVPFALSVHYKFFWYMLYPYCFQHLSFCWIILTSIYYLHLEVLLFSIIFLNAMLPQSRRITFVHIIVCVSYHAHTRYFLSVLYIHSCNFLDYPVIPLLALNNLFYMIPQYNYEYVGGLNRSEEEQMNNIPRDQRTFDIIRNVGDDIHKSIQLTADVPSNYSDGRVPIYISYKLYSLMC